MHIEVDCPVRLEPYKEGPRRSGGLYCVEIFLGISG